MVQSSKTLSPIKYWVEISPLSNIKKIDNRRLCVAITTPHPCLTDQNPYPIPYERHTMRIWWWDIAESDIYPQNYFTTTSKIDRIFNKSGVGWPNHMFYTV